MVEICKPRNFHESPLASNLSYPESIFKSQKLVPTPGIEPGPPAWKAGILTTRPYGRAVKKKKLLLDWWETVIGFSYTARANARQEKQSMCWQRTLWKWDKPSSGNMLIITKSHCSNLCRQTKGKKIRRGTDELINNPETNHNWQLHNAYLLWWQRLKSSA